MVSNRKKRQSKRRSLSHLDDFDQDIIIGNDASERRERLQSMKLKVTEILPLVILVKNY